MRPLHWRAGALGAALLAANLLVAPLVVQAQSSPSSPGVHVVQDGETLGQIALDAGTDAATLASLNGLDDANTLSIGQSLKLPSRSAAAPAATAAPSATYTVSDGDTLWDIAQHFGTTTDAIVQLNHLDDANHLSLGMVLKVPSGRASALNASAPSAGASSTTASSAATGASTAPAANATGPSSSATAAPSAAAASKRNLLVSYTVQPGETLGQIARQFDVQSDAIAQATNLPDPNKLAIGTVLKVPVPAREHVVTAGETLRDIAASEQVDLGSLIDFNQLDDPKLIRPGQVVLLPIAANQQAATLASSTVAGPEEPAAASNAAAALSDSAAKPAPTPKPTPAATPSPTPAATPASPPAAAPNPTRSASPAAAAASQSSAAGAAPAAAKPAAPAPKPAAPLAVVAAPPGSPTDGLAGAGLKLLGSSYVWGGSNPITGFDCSGFVWYVAKQAGKQLSRGMFGQYNSGSHPARDQLQVGDLVFFQNTFTPGLSHDGIYIGNGQFVSAADESAGVTISSLNTPYWSSRWFGATRLP
jgi:cell wall-associated NlpC family hydrolase